MCADLLGSLNSRSSCKRCCSTGVGACLFSTVGAGEDEEGRGDRDPAASDICLAVYDVVVTVTRFRKRNHVPHSLTDSDWRNTGHSTTVAPVKLGIMGSSDSWMVSVAIVWIFSVIFFLVLLTPVQGVVTRFRINYTPKGVGLGEHGEEQTLSQDMRVGPVVNSVRLPFTRLSLLRFCPNPSTADFSLARA